MILIEKINPLLRREEKALRNPTGRHLVGLLFVYMAETCNNNNCHNTKNPLKLTGGHPVGFFICRFDPTGCSLSGFVSFIRGNIDL